MIKRLCNELKKYPNCAMLIHDVVVEKQGKYFFWFLFFIGSSFQMK